MTASPAGRSLAAEVRAVEGGHRAFVQDDGSILVKSDTHAGKFYRVTFAANVVGDPVTFTCQPEGEKRYADDHLDLTGFPGYLPCQHAALAARRLAREGLAMLTLGTGAWVLTQKAADLTERRLPPQPADPFDGLPSERPLPAPEPVDPADAAAGRKLLGSM